MNLTDEQKTALNVGLNAAFPCDLYVIVKRGLYYREGAHGYTASLHEAWKLPLAEAKKYEMYADRTDIPGCEKVLVEPLPAIDYLDPLTGLSHIHRLEERLLKQHTVGDDKSEFYRYICELEKLCGKCWIASTAYRPTVWECFAFAAVASAEQRAITLARTLKLNIEGL